MPNRINNKVVLIGYSGHALVTAEALVLSGYQIIGYLEKERIENNRLNIAYLGFEKDSEVLKKIKGNFVFPAIGNNRIRQKVLGYFEAYGFEFINAIHAKSYISDSASIGPGIFVACGAIINPFATIGKGVIINTGAIVEHECIINDFSHIAPGAVLAGNVTIGNGSFIGANSVIKQGICIGDNVVIGAGAVITKDILDEGVYVGNPAKKLAN